MVISAKARMALSCVVILLTAACSRTAPAVKDGDIIFQTSKSSQSVAVQHATHSRYSHMGIIFLRDRKPYVLEASATVKYTPLSVWIARGQGGGFVVKRLRSELTPAQIEKLRATTPLFEGRPYDLTFEWSDSRIYCSELVWKLYDRALGIQVGRLQKLSDFDLTDRVVRAKLTQRYGNDIPMESTVISPSAVFEAPELKVVAQAN
jgi:hypothetical protein